jgi:hypothetical protein
LSDGGQGDRASVEHGLPGDTAAARQELERRMRARRLAAGDEAGRKALRRGSSLRSQEFNEKMVEQIDGKIGEHREGLRVSCTF